MRELWWVLKEFFLDYMLPVIAPLTLFGVLLWGAFAFENHSRHVACKRLNETTGMHTKVVGKVDAKCFINIEGRWVPAESWRNF